MLFSTDFYYYMVNVRGFSRLSAETYSQCLDKFSYWMMLRGIAEEKNVSVIDAARFFAWCSKEQNLCAKTINLHRSALISYYSYCCKFGGYTANPFRETDPMKVAKKLPRWITEDVINDVVSRFDAKTFIGARDKVLILLMAHCGLRASEICNLAANDLNYTEVIVHGKGDKWRVVPVSIAIKLALDDYLSFRNKIVSPYFFVQYNNKQLTRAALFSIVRRAFANSCPPECCHPHALRHSFATICMLHNVPISSIAHWMGHSSETTTLKYMAVVGANENPFDKF